MECLWVCVSAEPCVCLLFVSAVSVFLAYVCDVGWVYMSFGIDCAVNSALISWFVMILEARIIVEYIYI